MNYLSLLIWVPQFGIAVASPIAIFLLLAIWIQDWFGVGNWIIWLGIVIGLYTAYIGARDTLKALALTDSKRKKTKNTISFNDHS